MSQWENDPTRQYSREPGNFAYGPPGPGQRPGQPGQPGHPQQNPFGTEGNEQFGIASMVFSLLGGILLIVCLTGLQWFSRGTNDGGSVSYTFGDVGDSLTTDGFATAYFGWFAWVFLVISVGTAIGASFPSPALRALRVLGVVTAFAAAGLSFLAVQVNVGSSYVDWITDARIGFYLAVVAFVLIGVGAAIGPRKV